MYSTVNSTDTLIRRLDMPPLKSLHEICVAANYEYMRTRAIYDYVLTVHEPTGRARKNSRKSLVGGN